MEEVRPKSCEKQPFSKVLKNPILSPMPILIPETLLLINRKTVYIFPLNNFVGHAMFSIITTGATTVALHQHVAWRREWRDLPAIPRSSSPLTRARTPTRAPWRPVGASELCRKLLLLAAALVVGLLLLYFHHLTISSSHPISRTKHPPQVWALALLLLQVPHHFQLFFKIDGFAPLHLILS